MSRVLCIIDGMNDYSFCPDNYPALAAFPERGFVNTVPDGFEAETLPCVLSLLGINPPQHIRGWIEALGAGIGIGAADLVLRGSWVKLDKDGKCIGYCNASENIPEQGRARYVSLGGYKSLLIFPGFASYVSSIPSTLPFNLFGKCLDKNTFSDIAALRDTFMQINSIDSQRAMIPWAPSAIKKMPELSQSAAVCGTNVIKGIAKALNMRLFTNNSMTGDTDTDLNVKLHYTLTLAEEYPFVMLHIGGCDEASHRMNKAEKEEFLYKIDRIVLANLLLSGHTIEVASDHGSDPQTGLHIGGEQPFFNRK